MILTVTVYTDYKLSCKNNRLSNNSGFSEVLRSCVRYPTELKFHSLLALELLRFSPTFSPCV